MDLHEDLLVELNCLFEVELVSQSHLLFLNKVNGRHASQHSIVRHINCYPAKEPMQGVLFSRELANWQVERDSSPQANNPTMRRRKQTNLAWLTRR